MGENDIIIRLCGQDAFAMWTGVVNGGISFMNAAISLSDTAIYVA